MTPLKRKYPKSPVLTEVTYDVDLQTAGTRFEGRFFKVLGGIAEEAAAEAIPELQDALKPPRAVVYPIAWESERQRRAFFASDGFGRGIPYQRTGDEQKRWTFRAIIDRDRRTIRFVLRANSPVSRYLRGTFVTGKWWQQMHQNTGWTSAAVVRQRTLAAAQYALERKFTESLRGFAVFSERD